MTSYQFVVLRYVHSAATQEFANIGLVMWLPNEKRVLWKITDHYSRLSAFFRDFNGPGYREVVRLAMRRFMAAASQLEGQSEATKLFTHTPRDLKSFLEPIILHDASALQHSQFMSGVTKNADARFESLFREFVEPAHQSRLRIDETAIMGAVESKLRSAGLLVRMESKVEVMAPDYGYRFRLGWMNGIQQVLEPISFDYKAPAEVVDKANTWTGRLLNLSKGEPFALTGIVAPPPNPDLAGAFEQALRILHDAPRVRRLVTNEEMDSVISDIEADLASHS